jgi:hypothetical protein
VNKYGVAAVDAVNLYNSGRADSPQDAWEKATTKVFGLGTSSQRKGCPKGAFLGLCEEGLVRGIEPGSYTGSQKNKGYAIRAVSILKQRLSLANSRGDLWDEVLRGEHKKHNSQMDVVIALWKSGLIQV